MAVLGGCANRSASSGVYSYDQAQREQIVRTGTVTGVRPIVIQNDKSSGAGMLAGGALGGVAGNAVGGGTGRTIATVGGAILGALARQCHRELGWQVVRLRNHGAPGQRRNPCRGPGSRCAHQRRPTRPGDQRGRPHARHPDVNRRRQRKARASVFSGPRRKAAGTPRRRAERRWRGVPRAVCRSAATRRTVITLEMPYFCVFRDFGRKFHGDSTVEVP